MPINPHPREEAEGAPMLKARGYATSGHFRRDCKKAQEGQGLIQPGVSQGAEARTQQSEGPAMIRQ